MLEVGRGAEHIAGARAKKLVDINVHHYHNAHFHATAILHKPASLLLDLLRFDGSMVAMKSGNKKKKDSAVRSKRKFGHTLVNRGRHHELFYCRLVETV